jgi:LytTr DNA-binding domain-containing protein
MSFALRETTHLGRWPRELAVLLAMGAILGCLGPYGTYCFGVADRLAFWMLRSLLYGLPCLLALRLVAATAPGASWPPVGRALVAVLIASVPSALIGFALATFLRRAPTSPLEFADLYGRVTFLTAVVGIPLYFVPARGTRGNAVPALQRPEQSPGMTIRSQGSVFLRRIPAKLGTDILYIEVEDHYLRVHTARGSDLILCRLSDAAGELGQTIGRQVHRSYWVARHAVAKAERDGHRTFLVLTSGARIPVSRTYLPALRQAGWL